MTAHGYGVIMADPPWEYRNAGTRGAAANQYPTMGVDAICSLPVVKQAASDSALLLWCCWPQMREGLRVLDAWGFEYVTGFPWIKATDASPDLWGEIHLKVPYGVGWWVRGCSEFVMIGKRGKPKPPPNGFVGLLSPNLRHSRKPESLYHYAEAMSGPYLELFARRPREGWDAWGNEVQGAVELAP